MPFVIIFFREVFNLMDAMKVDMANFQLQSIKPHLVQQSIEYERNKFKDYLQSNPGKSVNLQQRKYICVTCI